jgi:hypothetical protein
MDDGPGREALVPVRVDVGHHVVAQLAFVLFGGCEVDGVNMLAKLCDLLLGDWQPQFRFSLS